jgi:hypothetical protein
MTKAIPRPKQASVNFGVYGLTDIRPSILWGTNFNTHTNLQNNLNWQLKDHDLHFKCARTHIASESRASNPCLRDKSLSWSSPLHSIVDWKSVDRLALVDRVIEERPVACTKDVVRRTNSCMVCGTAISPIRLSVASVSPRNLPFPVSDSVWEMCSPLFSGKVPEPK